MPQDQPAQMVTLQMVGRIPAALQLQPVRGPFPGLGRVGWHPAPSQLLRAGASPPLSPAATGSRARSLCH